MFKKLFIWFVLMFCLCLQNKVFASEVHELAAKSAILIDQKSGKILYSKNEHERIYPASTTKILTAILAMEYLDMDALYVVGREINDIPLDSSKAGHKVGESISGKNLIRGLIIPSGNETACVVAIQVARIASGDDSMNYAQAEKYFSDLMNEKAKQLGALGSNFVNPHGYHSDDHYTTAYDMALISKDAMNNEILREIAKEKSFSGNGAGDNAADDLITQEYSWASHNLLLNSDVYSYPYANGIKTGFTDEAGHSVSASAEKDSKFFIAVVFNSPEPKRWEDSTYLFELGFNNYDYQTLVHNSETVANIPLDKPCLGELGDLELISASEFTGLFSQEEMAQITVETVINPENMPEDSNETILKAPLAQGDVVGSVVYKLGSDEVFKTDLLAGRDAQRRTLVTDINYYFNLIKNNAFTLKAVPFWIGGLLIVFLIIYIISKIGKRRNRYGF